MPDRRRAGAAPRRPSRRALVVTALVVGAVALSSIASAVGPGGWDHLGDAGTAGSDSLNGNAYALNADAPGVLVVGGIFTDAGGIAAADRIAAWNGSTWSAVGSASSQIDNGAVHAIAFANSKVYAGGTFLNAGGNADADFLAVWDGVSWEPFCDAVGPAFGGNVNALQVIGSTLYVGGSFQDAINTPAADYLVACDLSSGASSVTTTDPAHPMNGPIYALTADSNGVLYAGGGFHNVENIAAADNVAYRDAGGWHAMGSGGGPCGCAIDGFVRSLAANASGVYVGTDVKDVDGIAQADNVVKWDGVAWSAMGANSAGTDGWFPTTTYIYGMTASGTDVFATGSFQNADGDSRADQVARFSGGVWKPVGSDGAGNGPWIGDGLALAVFGQRLHAAGGFTSAGGDTQARGVASYPLSPAPAPTPTVTPAPTPVPTPRPDTTITSGPAAGSTIRDNTPTWEFSSSAAGAIFHCEQQPAGGIGSHFYYKPCVSPFTPSPLPDAQYHFAIAASIGAGADGPGVFRTYTIDTSRPRAALSGPLTQAAGSTLGVNVSCGTEACTAVASGTVSVPGAARVYRLRSATKKVAARHKASLKLGVPKAALRAIRAALRHKRRLTAKITVRVTDRAGNARASHRSVKLRR